MRLWHHWETWECVPAGLFRTTPPDGMDSDACRAAYSAFLRDTPRFEAALSRVLGEWPVSCEQFLSNEDMNRIAWLGQASMCIATGVPACYRAGFKLLTDGEQATANATAARALGAWLASAAHRPLVQELVLS